VKTPGWRTLLVLFALAAAFIGGIGLGEALHDRPDLSGSVTIVRTLRPLTVTPVATETVTVTTTTSTTP